MPKRFFRKKVQNYLKFLWILVEGKLRNRNAIVGKV